MGFSINATRIRRFSPSTNVTVHAKHDTWRLLCFTVFRRYFRGRMSGYRSSLIRQGTISRFIRISRLSKSKVCTWTLKIWTNYWNGILNSYARWKIIDRIWEHVVVVDFIECNSMIFSIIYNTIIKFVNRANHDRILRRSRDQFYRLPQ